MRPWDQTHSVPNQPLQTDETLRISRLNGKALRKAYRRWRTLWKR